MTRQATFQGATFNVEGDLKVESKAPDFSLVKSDLSVFKLSENLGSVYVISVVPSLDTGVCQASARAFNKSVSSLNGVKLLCVSEDLPFASSRFCQTEGLDNVITLSNFRKLGDFAKDYGVKIVDGPLAGLLARAVFVINKQGQVVYVQYVNEITEEPDYEKAINAAKSAL